MSPIKYSNRSIALTNALKKHILILDGAMGTMIPAEKRGQCADLLSLTAPEIISDIHIQYLNAGASIIETNSINANAITLAKYGLSDKVREINLASAQLAKKAVTKYCTANKEKQCWIAGSVGPTSKPLSLINNIPSIDILNAYVEQISALIEGGIDVLLIETAIDSMTIKETLSAAHKAMEQVKQQVPIMLSLTPMPSGRLLSGETLDSFITTIANEQLLSIGFNCISIEDIKTHLKSLQQLSIAISGCPNAGFPNKSGEYSETPESMSIKLHPLIKNGKINIVGGCCGTTPQHIKAISTIINSSY